MYRSAASVVGSIGLLAAALVMALPTATSAQQKQKVMTITATEPMTTDNPYGESSSPVYSLWCHTYGCLGRYDYTKRQLVGILAEKWEAIDATTWRFTLRKNLKRHDGGPGPTSADVGPGPPSWRFRFLRSVKRQVVASIASHFSARMPTSCRFV